MNVLIVSGFLVCAVVALVKSDDQLPVCGLLGGDDARIRILADCAEEHFPQVGIEIIGDCYERTYGHPGNHFDYLKKLCDPNPDQAKAQAMEKCADEDHEHADDVTDEELDKAVEEAEECLIKKAGVLLL